MSARRVMGYCPYEGCEHEVLPIVAGTRLRPKAYQLVRCVSSACAGYSIRKLNGFVYPMSDRTDPDSDPLVRILGP
jgi:hypothetical protein